MQLRLFFATYGLTALDRYRLVLTKVDRDFSRSRHQRGYGYEYVSFEMRTICQVFLPVGEVCISPMQ